MGEVFYEGNKKYNCRKRGKPYFRLTAVINGVQKDFYGDGEKDAKKKRDEAIALAAQGLDINKKNARVGPTFRRWLFEVKRVDKNIKASSFARYETTFRRHIEPYPIAKGSLSNLTSLTLQNYLTALHERYGVGDGALKHTIALWKMFCAWAVEEGHMVKNPCNNIVNPGQRDKGRLRVIETFTSEERERLAAYMAKIHYRYDTLILLGFATGMRIGELLGLRWSDIRGDVIHVERSTALVAHVDEEGNRDVYREIWDTKTVNGVRDIPLLPGTMRMLQEHKQKQIEFFGAQQSFVFTTAKGKLIADSCFRDSYKRLLERAGIPYKKFHAIRHTFATEMIRAGVNVKDLQMLMGHANIDTTYIYVHADEASKRAAIERMGEII